MGSRKKALQHNAAAVIFAHNHLPGILEPSQANKMITAKLKEALVLMDNACWIILLLVMIYRILSQIMDYCRKE